MKKSVLFSQQSRVSMENIAGMSKCASCKSGKCCGHCSCCSGK